MDGALQQVPSWLILLAGLSSMDDPSCLATPAYHQISQGIPYTQVERLLGAAPHGCMGFFVGYSASKGFYRGTYGEGRWENQFGTMTIRHENDVVTVKSFRPNAAGRTAFDSYQRLRRAILAKANPAQRSIVFLLGRLFTDP